MMELKQVGEILARAMNWIPTWDSHGIQWWVIPASCGRSFSHMLASNWTPWDNWEQCGWVIEEMHKAEWEFKLSWDRTMAVAAFQKEWGLYHAIVKGANLVGVCYAVSLAAARALEAEVNDAI